MSIACPEPDRDDAALVTVHDTSCCLRSPSRLERLPSILVGGGILACMFTIIALGACLPLRLLWVLGGVFVALISLSAWPVRNQGALAVAPSAIADLEIRDVYRALLAAHAELASAVVHHGSSPITRALLDQSRDLVIACGQRARTTNPGARYLAAHTTAAVEDRAGQAQAHARDDEPAIGALWAATDAARQRQLGAMQALLGQRARVRAELEAAVARLEGTAAEVVKQHMLDVAAVADTRGSCAEHAALLQDTLEGLQSAQAALPPAAS